MSVMRNEVGFCFGGAAIGACQKPTPDRRLSSIETVVCGRRLCVSAFGGGGAGLANSDDFCFSLELFDELNEFKGGTGRWAGAGEDVVLTLGGGGLGEN